MDDILKIIGIIVAIQGCFKAIEYFIDKAAKGYIKSKKIDDNEEDLETFKTETNAAIGKLQKDMMAAHMYASDSLKTLEQNLTNVFTLTLDEHKKEYVKRIEGVEGSITNMSAVYQQTVAVVDIKIENLEKAQNKHNNLIERMYKVEEKTALQGEQIKVANHRIEDLEKKE